MGAADRSEDLLTITKRNLTAYGRDVVEQRAVPDYRDGLKPVHRCILWALYGLGLKHTSPFKKAARTVGEVIGKYHPHGDKSAYDAMVGLAGTKDESGKRWVTRNSSVPLVEGYGNWGDNVDDAASYRYTEARLSEFSCLYLLDPVYLAVSEYVPNFSEDDKIPVVLPAKLPVLLLNGSVSIAFGVSAETPSFKIEGVLELVRQAMGGVKATPELCLKHLKFNPTYGGECISDKTELKNFFKAGNGSLQFVPEIRYDESKKTMTLVSACPGLTSPTSWTSLTDKLDQNRLVQRVSDSTDKDGFKYEIVAVRGADWKEFTESVFKLLIRKASFDIGVTDRTKDDAKFFRCTVSDIINKWCAWRIELEKKAIQYLMSLEDKKLARLHLMLLAVDNLKIIMDSLRKDDSAAYLMKALKITQEQADAILELKVRQLKALERAPLKKSIAECNAELKALKSDLKKPERRILENLKSVKV